MLNWLWNVDPVLDEFWNDDEMLIEFLMNVETTMKCCLSWWLASPNDIRDGWLGYNDD
jgi:hypothetical protein